MKNQTDKIITFSSGGLFPHKHKLEILIKDLDNVNSSVTFYTSEEYSLIFKHKHPVTLTIDQIKNIKSGQEVVVNDDNTKRHKFIIKI